MEGYIHCACVNTDGMVFQERRPRV